MSKPRSFRFSDEVEEVLEQRGDTKAVKAYIEGLILNTPQQKSTPHELTEGRVSYLLTQQTQEIIDALNNISLAPPNKNVEINRDGQVQPRDPAQPSSVSTRTKSTVKQEIDALEDERRAELEFVQDAESVSALHKKYQSTIDGLWREFHSL